MRNRIESINDFAGLDFGTLHSVLLMNNFHLRGYDDENVVVYTHNHFDDSIILYLNNGICTFAESVLRINYRLQIVSDYAYSPACVVLPHLRFLGFSETVNCFDNCLHHFENDKYVFTVVSVNGKVMDNFGHAK